MALEAASMILWLILFCSQAKIEEPQSNELIGRSREQELAAKKGQHPGKKEGENTTCERKVREAYMLEKNALENTNNEMQV